MRAPGDVTALLDGWNRGAPGALQELLPIVYTELRRVAARQLRAERSGHTLQPTALVHEAYLRLTAQRQLQWQSRAHFYGVAAGVMRRILVDYARRHHARKRGSGVRPVPLEEALEMAAPADVPVLGLDEALVRLAGIDPQLAAIVELRVFGGMTIDEVAHVKSVSPSTAKREWRTAKAWLVRELGLVERP